MHVENGNYNIIDFCVQEVGTGSHCKKYNIIYVEFLACADGLINHKDVPNSLLVTAYANKCGDYYQFQLDVIIMPLYG